ncbi:MAG: nicotinate-nucleotide adenylyltransferase [Betaproteobacteria bacterium]|nr:nicotinate-nucleotide adenylyltransferase [Betaproteobacteria bacterium]
MPQRTEPPVGDSTRRPVGDSPGSARLPLGVFGGTFDPVHLGHLRLAEEARESLGLAGVLWIPAGTPPHRDLPRAPADRRLEMVRLAIAGNPGFALDASEAFDVRPGFTVPTLERLRREHGPARSLVLLLGMDAFRGLATWHRWRELFELAHLAVAGRPGYAVGEAALPPDLAVAVRGRLTGDAGALGRSPCGAVVPFPMTPLDISATQIRRRLEFGQGCRYLVPESVREYIQTHGLYHQEPHGR